MRSARWSSLTAPASAEGAASDSALQSLSRADRLDRTGAGAGCGCEACEDRSLYDVCGGVGVRLLVGGEAVGPGTSDGRAATALRAGSGPWGFLARAAELRRASADDSRGYGSLMRGGEGMRYAECDAWWYGGRADDFCGGGSVMEARGS